MIFMIDVLHLVSYTHTHTHTHRNTHTHTHTNTHRQEHWAMNICKLFALKKTKTN